MDRITALLVDPSEPDLMSTMKVKARVYANIDLLAERCVDAGIIDSPSLIYDFFRGFTRARSLFDVIDVGGGQNGKQERVLGMH